MVEHDIILAYIVLENTVYMYIQLH